jgi:membrane protein implicated in regulation of membrane protease activity
MTVLYLASFIAGLLLAVRIMTHGVERPREKHPTGDRSFRLSPPVIVVFAMLFGIGGYLMTRAGLAPSIVAPVAALLGAVGSIIAARLVKRWWQVVPEHDVDDERYVLQGHLARVTKSIGPDVDGEVTFEFGGDRRLLRARGSVGGTIAADTDVVIERVEADVAYVEAWADVEKRL